MMAAGERIIEIFSEVAKMHFGLESFLCVFNFYLYMFGLNSYKR